MSIARPNKRAALKPLAAVGVLAFLLLFLAQGAAAQDIIWLRQFGTSAVDADRGVAVDAAGNVYVGGDTAGALPGQVSAGGGDAWVRQYNPAGSEVWTRQFGSSLDDSALGVAVDGAGNAYVAGLTNGTLPGQTSAGGFDSFLRKYDPAGNEVWTRQFGTAHLDIAEAVAVDGTGNAYVSGTGGQSCCVHDALLSKYDPAGNVVWTRQFGTPANDQGHSVAVDGAGNAYVAGSTQSTLPGQVSAGGDDAWVRKYDPAGTEVWTRQFGTPAHEEAQGVAVDGTGNAYVAGSTSTGGTLPGQTAAGGGDAFLRKYDPAGNEVWTRQFGTSANDAATEGAVDGAGNAYVTGYVSGALPGQIWAGVADAFARKYDPAGNEVWTRQFGSSLDDVPLGISGDGTGNVYVGGDTTGALPGQTSAGGHDAYVAKIGDATAPTITLTTPPDGAVYTLSQLVFADYTCADEAGGSGLVSCAGDVPDGAAIDTASVGPKTFTVTAEDNAGNMASVTHNYSVIYDFTGFFAPVDNTPALNVAKAGSAIPVKFSLSGDQGLAIFATGYPRSQRINCDSSLPEDAIEETFTAGSSSLSYDPVGDQYIYVWKTDKAWAGTCRQLMVRLNDLTEHVANFKFK